MTKAPQEPSKNPLRFPKAKVVTQAPKMDEIPLGKNSLCCLETDQFPQVRIFIYAPGIDSDANKHVPYDIRKTHLATIVESLRAKGYRFKPEAEGECRDNDTPAGMLTLPKDTPIETVRQDVQSACRLCKIVESKEKRAKGGDGDGMELD